MADPARKRLVWRRLGKSERIATSIATLVAAIAAVAVFIFPTADSRQPSSSPNSSAANPSGGDSGSSTATVPTAESTTGSAGSPTSTPAGRDLASVVPVIGAGLVEVEGRDLLVECPTNQSDDREREIAFNLTRSFALLVTDVSATGQRGPDDQAAVQVFKYFRQDRSDRQTEIGRAVVAAKQTAHLSADLKDAAQVALRITCTSRDQVVRFAAPRLIP